MRIVLIMFAYRVWAVYWKNYLVLNLGNDQHYKTNKEVEDCIRPQGGVEALKELLETLKDPCCVNIYTRA